MLYACVRRFDVTGTVQKNLGTKQGLKFMCLGKAKCLIIWVVDKIYVSRKSKMFNNLGGGLFFFRKKLSPNQRDCLVQ